LPVTPPLRVLAVVADPSDYPRLDVEREWATLRGALGGLQQRGLVHVERLDEARLPVLQQRLRQVPCHVLHFVGHGGFDTATRDGVLVLEGDDERSHLVSGQDLGVLLHDHRALRLVVLNACEGARASRVDPFAGTAQSLVQQGLPAVIAMQFEITDEAAIIFAREFYSAIADGYPVDASLAEARKALFLAGHVLEWGTPVLYTRTPDGRIFDVDRPGAHPAQPPAAVAPSVATAVAEMPPVAPASASLGIPGRGLVRTPWGLLAGAMTLLPLINMFAQIIPIGMWEGEGGGGFAYFSPGLVTFVATLSALFVGLWSLARRPAASSHTHASPIPPGVLPSLVLAVLALVAYAAGHSLVAGDFYFNVLGWQSDNRLRMLGDVLLTICYSTWFSLAARAVALITVSQSRGAR
jgi:hypothetical protein